ncbi:MAG: bifunctional proline dehydrogenase/L-glutamate gamma-semialdehyde dehydrogenase [Polyangiaceae bacterium]|nr:bifunctional proline dehydrogenase/L-glutamate gamma-semialdehyde dehydrogenase [Polyangiaceae bacterium]
MGDGAESRKTDAVLALSQLPRECTEQNWELWASAAVGYAEWLLEEAERRKLPDEKARQKQLADLLRKDRARLFSTALTDRFFRTTDSSRALTTLIDLIERSECLGELPLLERIELRAARLFGQAVPEITRQAVAHKIKEEASAYLWVSDPESLTAEVLDSGENQSINLNNLGEEVLGESRALGRCREYQSIAAQEGVSAISLKLSSIDSHLDVLDFDASIQRCVERVAKIVSFCKKVRPSPPLFYLDMESYADVEITVEVLCQLLGRFPDIRFGVALQAYLPESWNILQRLIQVASSRKGRNEPVRIRLVKGANLQMERVEASFNRWAVPTFKCKADVDANFKRLLRAAVQACDQGWIRLGVGSHNLFDISYALLLQKRMERPDYLSFEMLHGMVGALGKIVEEISGSLLVYTPIVSEGEFNAAVAYLVRRLDENTAPDNYLREAPHILPKSESFERQAALFRVALENSFSTFESTYRRQDRSLSMSDPHSGAKEENSGLKLKEDFLTFQNSSTTDWTRSQNRHWLNRALTQQQAQRPEVKPLFADGQQAVSLPVLAGFDPSNPGYSYPVTWANEEELLRAIEAADKAQENWSERPLDERAALLRRVAQELEEKRGELIAAMVLDAGKIPREADAEVAEAIDFARYYATQTESLKGQQGRGVVAVISPWNFPLAIPLGGILAALLAGNTVIFKPSPETPWVAQLAAQACYRAGVPRSVLQFLPLENEVASRIVEDERIESIVLTGSSRTARSFLKKTPHLRLMAETGGKNGLYVSPLCDRDEAIKTIVQSAFAHAGQKCSALSVLLLHRELYDSQEFRQQLVDATASLKVGSAWSPGVNLPPLIRAPQDALAHILDKGQDFGRWLIQPRIDSHNPQLMHPGILWDVERGSRPQQQELFGPILSVVKVDSFSEAMQTLNSTSYGLTAGLHSLSEEEQEAFVQCAQAGNLYINRPITGAVVGRQPFGGYRGSSFGLGLKAGGPDYVLQFSQPLRDMGNLRHRAQSSEEEVIRSRKESYQQAFDDHFGKLHHGTHVYGERNWWRYLPGPCALVLGKNASSLDIHSALLARLISQNQHPVFLLDDDGLRNVESLVAATDPDARPLRMRSRDLATQALSRGIERLRVVGELEAEAQAAAAAGDLSLVMDPVTDNGRQELAPFVSAQTISVAYHRHGNTSLTQLSSLEEVILSDGLRSR